MQEINEKVIREKVMRLMKDMGVSKKKLGEVLGSKGDHVNVRINRANRFLTGDKKKLTIQEINSIADFFGKPATWFFYEDSSVNEDGSRKKENVDKEAVIQKIENEMRQLGFDEGFIGVQIQQIRAMDAYRSGKK
jgi:transcriptional regulator with XRE-family HTH domain